MHSVMIGRPVPDMPAVLEVGMPLAPLASAMLNDDELLWLIVMAADALAAGMTHRELLAFVQGNLQLELDRRLRQMQDGGRA